MANQLEELHKPTIDDLITVLENIKKSHPERGKVKVSIPIGDDLVLAEMADGEVVTFWERDGEIVLSNQTDSLYMSV